MRKAYLHVDLDAFFASVELLDHPEWKGLPVIVGGMPNDRRSVVSTASYEARKYGVHSAMPTFIAARLCPDGIFVHPRMERYLELSEKVMSIFARYSPDVQQISIDEAFIDLTGTEKLFGPPDFIAKKIKQEVKDETGLTVSAGLASTKYLAKIASEKNKPDGFFEVPPGKEEKFLLSLPLNKLWGIGKTTLDKLRQNAILTTEALHRNPLSLLTSIFGNATGVFLYNAVRGKETGVFSKEAKSHSISAENTYPYDLTHEDAINTALLELCHTVIWRLRKSHSRSCTAAIKIRYDDFSTFSAQETTDREIGSLDDFFDRIKKLFYKKADRSRGIRLLGAAALNVESENEPHQRELFSSNDERRRKVEEAVFKAENKIPGVKITRARLLPTGKIKSLIAVLAAALLALQASVKASAESGAEERNADGAGAIVFDTSRLPPSMSDSGRSIFNYGILDKNVEFIAEGYWKSLLTGSLASTFGFGASPSFSASTPVISSEVDLSLWFMLDRKWYFEAAFADSFDKNTVAAGYYGDGYLKEARVANRGIVFPSTYSIDTLGHGIGGGTNLSPGISLHFEGNSWAGDVALRYENLEQKSRTWYGKNLVTELQIPLEEYITGFQYILPSEEAVLAVSAVYVEASNGDFKDSRGRKYKKLDSSQYLLSASDYSIFLSRSAKAQRTSGTLPAVAIEYSSTYAATALSELGSYGLASSPGTGFLGMTQETFEKYNLEEYSLPLTAEISGNTVFYIQYPSRFSPYAACYRYDGGLISSGEASVRSSTTGIASTEYMAVLGDDSFSEVLNDFFSDGHLYADISVEEAGSMLSAFYRFPFAKKESGIYLGLKESGDLAVDIRSYTSVSRFDIGTDAVAGTVKAYKNGIQDTGAVYDSDSGTVTMSVSVSSADKITVHWSEDSSDASMGAVAMAAGLKRQLTGNVSGDISVATRWSFAKEENYSKSSADAQGFTAVAANLSYSKDNFYLSSTIGASVESVNTEGKYMVSKMDEEETSTAYLSRDAAVNLPESIAPVLNARSSSASSIYLDTGLNGSVPVSKGKTDSEISGYAVPVEWDFTSISESASENSPYWAAVSLSLPGNSGLLASASSFSIALKSDSLSLSSCKIYLQLGVEADEDLSAEDSDFIPTWRIDTGSLYGTDVRQGFDCSRQGWQIVTVVISDKDKQLLSTSYNGRIIITSTSAQAGRILAGPYEASGLGFSISAENGSNVYASQICVSGSNYCQFFDFQNTSLENFMLTRYFEEMNFEDYENLIVKLKLLSEGKFGEESMMKIRLDRPKKNGDFETAVELELDADDLNSFKDSGAWRNLKINLFKKSAETGNVNKVDQDIAPTRFAIELTADIPSSLYIDELYFSGNKPYLALQNKTEAGWKQQGSITTSNGYEILKELEISAKADSTAVLKQDGALNDRNFFTGSAETSMILANILIEGQASRSSSTSLPVSTASHNIMTDKPILKILDVQEKYTFNHDDESLEKLNSAKLNFSSLKIPLILSVQASADSDPAAMNQNIKASASFSSNSLVLQANSSAKQKMSSSSKDVEYYSTTSYTESWKEITRLAFSEGNENSLSRTIALDGLVQAKSSFLGFSPSYKAALSSAYKNSSLASRTDTVSQNFWFPFSIGKNSFSLRWQKTTGQNASTVQSRTYMDDAEEILSTLSGKSWYFKTMPFHDLFSDNISNEICSSSVSSLYYSTLYTAEWKRSFQGSAKDFFIPSGASIALERDIKTSSSSSDIYQVKGIMNFNALNVFGRKSALRWLDFFEQDEYITSLTAVLRIPRETPADTAILISFYQQSVLYFSTKNTLKTGLEISFEDKDNLSAKATFIWKRPGSRSPLDSAISHIYRAYNNNKEKGSLTRTDSLNIAVYRTSSASSTDSNVKKRQNCDYSHLLDIKLNSFAELNTSLGLSYSCVWEEIITIGASAGIGATIKF